MDELPETYSSSTPFKELHQKEISETISKAVDSLPENQRIALLLHHFEGMKYAEIAGVMNTSVSAVESLLFRAKKTLREKLKLFQMSTAGFFFLIRLIKKKRLRTIFFTILERRK